ncbi:MAG: SRPBCC family protein [Candidatus Nanopelagicales bacterium]|jgi:ribosome-associated toxin RatA of RatAB toxin-antitoxin module|nr:SRPBCC family protein [Candidatus Nanopelagicales bacterium]
MAVSDSLSVIVNAPVDQVLAFLRDIDNQKNWFPGNSDSEVLERDDQGRPSKARLVNDVKVAKDEFTLDYTHTDDGFSWRLPSPTKVQRMQEGSWRVVDAGGRSEATMSLTLDTSLPLPGFVQRKTVKDTLKGATSALAKQF